MRNILVLAMATVLAGCAATESERTPVTLEFRPGALSAGSGLTEMTPTGSSDPVYISKEVLLSNADVKSARAKTGPSGPQVEILFTEAGAERFAQTTEKLIGKPLAIFIDGQLISAPRVMERIAGGKVIITGSFSEEEAERIARGINRK